MLGAAIEQAGAPGDVLVGEAALDLASELGAVDPIQTWHEHVRDGELCGRQYRDSGVGGIVLAGKRVGDECVSGRVGELETTQTAEERTVGVLRPDARQLPARFLGGTAQPEADGMDG